MPFSLNSLLNVSVAPSLQNLINAATPAVEGAVNSIAQTALNVINPLNIGNSIQANQNTANAVQNLNLPNVANQAIQKIVNINSVQTPTGSTATAIHNAVTQLQTITPSPTSILLPDSNSQAANNQWAQQTWINAVASLGSPNSNTPGGSGSDRSMQPSSPPQSDGTSAQTSGVQQPFDPKTTSSSDLSGLITQAIKYLVPGVIPAASAVVGYGVSKLLKKKRHKARRSHHAHKHRKSG